MSDRVIFTNAAVFDGLTPHLREGHSVVVEDGTIVELREGAATVTADRTIDLAGRTLMPGLIDLHTHACLTDVIAPVAVQTQAELVTLHAVKTLKNSLMYGFTAIRDAGGMDGIFSYAMDQGLIEGPRLYHAGRFITMTGGHGDMRDPLRAAHAGIGCCAPPGERFISIADGADQVRKAVREELRRGAKHIKLFLSGGVMSPTGSIEYLQFTEDEIRAAVEEATAQGKYVMAHCHPDAAIRRATELGVRSIEHCSFVSEETAKRMVEKGAFAVPTLAVGKALNEEGDKIGISEANKRKLGGAFEAMQNSLALLHRTGVKIGFGSDVSGQFQSRQCSEFSLRAEILPAYDILLSATSVAAEVLGEQGRLGVIAPGAHADLIAVDGNPLDDVRILDRAGAALPMIMKAGQFHKCTL